MYKGWVGMQGVARKNAEDRFDLEVRGPDESRVESSHEVTVRMKNKGPSGSQFQGELKREEEKRTKSRTRLGTWR